MHQLICFYEVTQILSFVVFINCCKFTFISVIARYVCFVAPHVAGGFQQLVFGLQVQSEFLQVESLDRGECRALPPFQHLSAAFIFSTVAALVVITV